MERGGGRRPRRRVATWEVELYERAEGSQPAELFFETIGDEVAQSMGKQVADARWRQLRSRALATPEGQRHYGEGYQRAVSYQQTMALINDLRRKLGISQRELARRMERAQPTVARLLSRGQNPTLASLEEVLRALGVRGRLAIEPGATGESALTVEVREPAPA